VSKPEFFAIIFFKSFDGSIKFIIGSGALIKSSDDAADQISCYQMLIQEVGNHAGRFDSPDLVNVISELKGALAINDLWPVIGFFNIQFS
jgi:hypothetical protein